MLRTPFALKAGVFLIALLALLAGAGLFVSDNPPHDLTRAFAGPRPGHLLGFDAFGVDLSLRIARGAWQSLRTGVLVTVLTMTVGLTYGTACALSARHVDLALSRLMDCLMAFPGLLLAILIASIMPHSNATVLFALSATGWTSHARFCRALVAKISTQPYIEAARASGASTGRLLTRHVWPQLSGQLLIQGALSVGYVILAESSLAFLGLCGAGDNSSWGRLIAEGREYLVEAPHLSIMPGIFFALSVFAFIVTAEGLRYKLDPSRDIGVY